MSIKNNRREKEPLTCLSADARVVSLTSVLPSFTKTPMDLTIRAGAMARLECAALGHPAPQIAWQKDGGTDFPAARERRMHVMPEDDVFFIVDVKTEDIGVYSCTAQNSAGSISANATLTVLGEWVCAESVLSLHREGARSPRDPPCQTLRVRAARVRTLPFAGNSRWLLRLLEVRVLFTPFPAVASE